MPVTSISYVCARRCLIAIASVLICSVGNTQAQTPAEDVADVILQSEWLGCANVFFFYWRALGERVSAQPDAYVAAIEPEWVLPTDSLPDYALVDGKITALSSILVAANTPRARALMRQALLKALQDYRLLQSIERSLLRGSEEELGYRKLRVRAEDFAYYLLKLLNSMGDVSGDVTAALRDVYPIADYLLARAIERYAAKFEIDL